MPIRYVALSLASFAWATAFAQQAPAANAPPQDTQALVTQIEADVAAIRGLPFKRPVKAEKQSTADFEKYLEEELNRGAPLTASPYYGKIVRKLGLYRGPEIENGKAMIEMVMSSQAAAYYDPDKQTFFVLMSNMPDMLAGVLYSHELYHGLQDQYFNLDKYVMEGSRNRALDSDELTARQAVVEGEATYIMNLWTMKKTLGVLPPRETLQQVIAQQSQISTEELRASLKEPQVATVVGQDIANSVEAMDKIPPFLIDNLIGAYLKGLGFIFEVQGQGWPAVEKLYTTDPPLSTEQILHPEKWFAHEAPLRYTWPAFANEKALAGWQVLDEDVIGEMQWISIFKEFGMNAQAPSIAAGWDGDRYAILKRKDSDALLLLLRTSWDTKGDADEFAAAYRKLLTLKYADAPQPTRVAQQGNEVLIVEGGDAAATESLVKFVAAAAKQRKSAR